MVFPSRLQAIFLIPLKHIIGINVTAGPVFVAAFREFLSSELGKKAPGLIRLVANRAGSDISHTVLVTAPSFAALNKYLDSSSANKTNVPVYEQPKFRL